MSTGIFSIGTSALTAAYTALRTAGNNVANANTPGYTRQVVVLSPQVGTFLGGNFLGQGVAVADVRRVYDDFLTQQAHQAQAAASQSEMRHLRLAQVANLFADPTTGVGAAVDHFFRQVQDLTQRPADPAARQALLSAARLMASRFNDVGDRLQEFRSSTTQQLRLEIDAVNRLAREVAQLNDKIALARGAGRMPNDLLDRRDVAIRRLNESVRVSVVLQDDGAANLFLGNGQPLVVGNRPTDMGMDVDPIDPQAVRVGIRAGASIIALSPGQVGGGRIAGHLQFLADDLPQVENELGRLAATLAGQVNTQHRLGDDRNGQPGGDFFVPPAPRAFGASTNGNPATTIAVAWQDTAQLVASDYRVDYSSAGGGTYTLTRLADGQTWTSATPTFSQDGLTITLANTPPASGDVFLVQPLRAAARDLKVAITQPAAIAAAVPVRAAVPAANIGSVTVEDLAVAGPARHPDLTLPVALTFTSATTFTYSVNGGPASPPQAYVPGDPIAINGWRLTLRGTPAAGDVIDVAANVGGVGDNRNAIRLAQLQDLALADGTRLGAAFAAVVARVGGETQSADLYAQSQRAILDDALMAESSVAGVNLDEEAARLIQYQQQYQAAAKVIAAGRAIFEEILSIAR